MAFKKVIIFVLFLLGNCVLAQQIANIEKIKIDSKELNQEREILVYTPQSYNENTLVSYDVIYVFDVQNREFFDFTHSVISFLSNTTKKYIIVGIISPYFEKLDYVRNNDMLPILETNKSKKRYGKYSGNADNFLKYIKGEVIPYIENNYRTHSNKVAIGHSLSASLILRSIFREPNLFNDYLAISPNFAFDNERLATKLIDFDYQKIKDQTFLYTSNANEGINYWKEWKPARNKIYSFFENSNNLNTINFLKKEFPNETHWSTFPPSLTFGLTEYFKYLEKKEIKFSEETYEITIELKVTDKMDEVYIAGNQLSLGNWNPGLIKMKNKSDFEREITIKIKMPLELKFTRGTWENQGLVKNMGGFENIRLNPQDKKVFKFEIVEWADTMK